VTQSVAIIYITDGLEEEVSTLTVFTNIAREIVFSPTPLSGCSTLLNCFSA
jgi:hypothetical protein